MPSPCSPLTFRLLRFEESFSVFPDHGVNPHYTKIRDESRAWISQYSHVYGLNMRAFMDNCGVELLAAYTYPSVNELQFRAPMDLVKPPSRSIQSF